ncbi:MAG: TetR/AcrR family transcriptional regulator [Fidelibacterota bacterium]|nr:MAG: TetR/AcrR family transcriptional regulator [Candidatus Neomarinimicrobiota bacterium]
MPNTGDPRGNRRSKKREQIIRTAEQLFSRFGAKRVTVEEICREANVSKMTFYKYFPNKVELVRTIRDDWEEEGFRRFDEINAMDLPFPEKIDLMTQWKVEFAARVNAEFIRELITTDEALERFKRRYLGNIASAQEKGEIRSDIDPEFLWMVVEKLAELVKEGSWKKVFSEISQYQHQLRTLLWYGLLTREEEER